MTTPILEQRMAPGATVTEIAADMTPSIIEPANPLLASQGASTLNPAQQQQVIKLARALESGGLAAVHDFGREIGQHAAAHADDLLGQVRGRDLEAMGTKLSQIVGAAQSLNMNALSGKRSGVPLLGALIDKVRLKAGDVGRRFQDVRGQIDTLVSEVDTMQAGLASRIEALSVAFDSIQQEHTLLQIHISAGETAKAGMQQRLTRMPKPAAGSASTGGADPLAAQHVQDTQAAMMALDKRVADLRMLQHAALQQLPMIRMVQNNNRMLIDKFHSIKELTVPAWKRQFMLALSLHEQKKAVELANTIDDATNQFLLDNARLLKDNTVSTARANQRLVIDIETLKEVNDTLLSTVQEVIQINRDGARQRVELGGQLKVLRESMVQQLSVRDSAPTRQLPARQSPTRTSPA